MRIPATTVDAYVEAMEPARGDALARLRAAIRRGAPGADERLRHGMPSYEVGGAILCAFASQKRYVSLYFCDLPTLARHRDRLGTGDCGKSCIRYRDPARIPLDVVEAMVRDGARAWAGRAAAGDPPGPPRS